MKEKFFDKLRCKGLVRVVLNFDYKILSFFRVTDKTKEDLKPFPRKTRLI